MVGALIYELTGIKRKVEGFLVFLYMNTPVVNDESVVSYCVVLYDEKLSYSWREYLLVAGKGARWYATARKRPAPPRPSTPPDGRPLIQGRAGTV